MQDQTANYQQSDLIYASQTVTFNEQALTFKHLPVKVVINLKNGDEVTEEDVKNATVSIINQALISGAIDTEWEVAQAEGSGTITTNISSKTSDYLKTTQALLVPQQMLNKQFIKKPSAQQRTLVTIIILQRMTMQPTS